MVCDISHDDAASGSGGSPTSSNMATTASDPQRKRLDQHALRRSRTPCAPPHRCSRPGPPVRSTRWQARRSASGGAEGELPAARRRAGSPRRSRPRRRWCVAEADLRGRAQHLGGEALVSAQSMGRSKSGRCPSKYSRVRAGRRRGVRGPATHAGDRLARSASTLSSSRNCEYERRTRPSVSRRPSAGRAGYPPWRTPRPSCPRQRPLGHGVGAPASGSLPAAVRRADSMLLVLGPFLSEFLQAFEHVRRPHPRTTPGGGRARRRA